MPFPAGGMPPGAINTRDCGMLPKVIDLEMLACRVPHAPEASENLASSHLVRDERFWRFRHPLRNMLREIAGAHSHIVCSVRTCQVEPPSRNHSVCDEVSGCLGVIDFSSEIGHCLHRPD